MKLIYLITVPRAIVFGFICALWTLVMSFISMILTYFIKSVPFQQFLYQVWTQPILFILNIKVTKKNFDLMPKENGIFIVNHVSHMDVIVIYAAITRPVRFGAKASLFKIPFFGQTMRNFGTLVIHRGKREEVLELYKTSLKNMDKYSYMLAPEGTRSDDGNMKPFKTGPFIMALAGQKKIVPVKLTGLYDILPKGSALLCLNKLRHEVIIEALEPISTEGKTMENLSELITQAQTLYS